MKKITLLLFIFSTFIVTAQEDAWVYFNAKPNAATFFDSPLNMFHAFDTTICAIPQGMTHFFSSFRER